MTETVQTALKMYILVKDTIPLGLAVNSVGHATIACYRRFVDHPEMKEWIDSPGFKKVTCSVPEGQFEAAKKIQDHIVMTERALGGAETCIAFRPRREWPKNFQFHQLFGAALLKELDALRVENQKLKDELRGASRMNEKERQATNEWVEAHKCQFFGQPDSYAGAIGGALTVSYTSTTIGRIVSIECACGEKKDVTDFSDW